MLLLFAGCSAAPDRATPVTDVPRLGGVVPAPIASLEETAPKPPVVEESRVGDLVLAQALSAARLGGEPAKRYVTTFYADAQPLEGFTFETPPLFAALRGGPFHTFGMENPGEPVPETMAAEAVALAERGELTVQMLVITSAVLRTREGIGVGSSYETVAGAYPKLETLVLPGLWEEPSCIAKPHAASTIHFFFALCAMRDAAQKVGLDEKVIRVVVVDTSSEPSEP